MECRNQGKTMGIPSSRVDDQRRESTIHEDSVFNPSPDRNQTHRQQQNTNSRPRRDPDPTQIASQPEPTSAITAATTIRYRDCQRNHAAHMGSHVVDGCGEFMPNGEEGTPEAMSCAACGCHRNFHRKEIDDGGRGGAGVRLVAAPKPTTNCYISFNTSKSMIPTTHTTNINTPPAIFHPSPFQQIPSIHHQRISHHPPGTMMAFGDGGGGGSGVHAESSSEDLNLFRSDGDGYGYGGGGSGGCSRKRFRTKFTQEQKDKMMEFARKIGWRIQKQDEDEVQRFCAESGVKRRVFKVWMHNNKQAMKRKQS